jgi:cytochrome c biogenesis factor
VIGFEIPASAARWRSCCRTACSPCSPSWCSLGTLYPLITEATSRRRKLSVGEPWFDRTAMPLGLLMVFLMGVGPALPWGRIVARARRAQAGGPRRLWPAVRGVFAGNGFDGPMDDVQPVAVRLRARRQLRRAAGSRAGPHGVARRVGGRGHHQHVLSRTRRRFGGHVAHYGAILAVVSITLWKGYKNEIDVTLRKGASAEIEGWTATYEGARLVQEPHRKSVIADFRRRAAAPTSASSSRGSTTTRPSASRCTRRRSWRAGAPTSTCRWSSSISDGAYVVVRLITMPGHPLAVDRAGHHRAGHAHRAVAGSARRG